MMRLVLGCSLIPVPSMYDHAGGEEALHRLESTFYESVRADPILQPLFGEGRPEHVDHLTAFTAESCRIRWPPMTMSCTPAGGAAVAVGRRRSMKT